MLSGERGVDDSAKRKERKSLVSELQTLGESESGTVGKSDLGTEEHRD